MKFKDNEEPVQTNINVVPQQYRISANAKSFAILTSNIYTNKVRAVIRELACNAYDSHVMNGNVDEPFQITLPTYLQPEFRIRDYGKSMDDNFVRGLYTILFESDKTNSNDFIGGIGIGSKSPFCLTDNFTVSCYLDGIKRTYSCFKENGLPQIVLLGNSETNEKNGVLIQVPVSNHLTQDFIREAKEVFKVFDKKPIITNPDWVFPKLDIVYQENNFYIEKLKNTYLPPEIYFIMGNVAYKYKTDCNFLKNGYNLYIKCKIGELDIHPSREQLSYDEETNNITLKYISDIKLQFENKIQTEIDKDPDNLANIVFCLNLLGFLHYKNMKLTFQNQNIWNDINYNIIGTYYYCKHNHTFRILPRTTISINVHGHGAMPVDILQNVYINDATKYKNHKLNTLKDYKKSFYLTNPDSISDLIKYKIPYKSLDQIPFTPIKKIRDPNQPKMSRKLHFKKYDFDNNSWKRYELNPNDSGYYILRDNNYIVLNNKKITLKTFATIESALKLFNVDLDNFLLIGCTQTQQKYLLNNKNLQSFEEFTKQISNKQIYLISGYYWDLAIENMEYLVKHSKIIHKYYNKLIENQSRFNTTGHYIDSTLHSIFTINKHKNIDVQHLLKLIYTKFPLLKHIEFYQYKLPEVKQYIELMEKEHENRTGRKS